MFSMTLGVIFAIGDCFRDRKSRNYFMHPLFYCSLTSAFLATNENERVYPDGYIMKPNSSVSPYFTFCGLATIGATVAEWMQVIF